jgi:NAD(P)-dependent dehydrogenase (short-subunit alcohol dehydrogenase family)
MAAWSLNEKVVLITGGARGIGAATAAELARRGAVPVLADLDADALEATAVTMSPTPLIIKLDVTDLAACEAAVDLVLAEHGRLDIAWANAGIASGGPVQLTDAAAWRRTIEVNLIGAYYTVRAALPAVIAQHGYMAVTASLASFAHAPGMSAYSASKAGVEAMANSLRNEVAHHGVDVATIHPTWIDTDMVREADAESRVAEVLRGALRPPFRRTYPVERAATDIATGFERRRRRICVPPFVHAAHALRPLLTTPLFERDARAVAPELERRFEEDVQQRGAAAASASERIARQVGERTAAPS